jgi:hypothetical protein
MPTSPEDEKRTPTGLRYVACDEIDEGLVELYALGRLPDAVHELMTHLETCEKCKPRVALARQRAKVIQKARGAARPS